MLTLWQFLKIGYKVILCDRYYILLISTILATFLGISPCHIFGSYNELLKGSVVIPLVMKKYLLNPSKIL